ncbi:3-isopropylmalate dehydratase small subunit [Sphingomonas sp. AR_OL41]|uniref:3-isopropylmalate dehydratase small subunit n=1 Tax=Sphingomonas sp. AR_OL41 TaxID=3042729 RepID=UPI002480A73A|nr:3-isopropylmalate dehydratase small subunit [Sphingomonas sp. AR_OL41]MDH7973217.1 3-isopropylmalate dehydratase small subunit [Sphingomonas sp. AR_OL41]
MEPFVTVSGPTVSLPAANIDTDIIFPARFLVITEKRGLGRYAFHDRPDLTLPPDVQILVAGENFGCGSSREQAPWALVDRGIRAIIAPGFGEIFQSNCFKNGILPIVLSADTVDRLHAAARGGEPFTVDLERQEIRLPQAGIFVFAVDPARREALLSGLDEIGRIHRQFAPAIADFENNQRTAAPWLWSTEQGAPA